MPLFPKFMEFGFGGGRREEGGSGGRSKRGMIDGKRGNKGGASLVAMEREGRLIRPPKTAIAELLYSICLCSS